MGQASDLDKSSIKNHIYFWEYKRICYVHYCINYNTVNKLKESLASENAETHNTAARSCGRTKFLSHILLMCLIVHLVTLYHQDACISHLGLLNPLAYTDVPETAGLARSINTQPAVRRNSETNSTSQHKRGMYWSQ